MPPENSAEIYFDRALNRPRESRGSQPSACFCGTFCTPQKVPTRTPLPGVSRFFKPRISPHKQQLPTNKIKTFPKGASRFFEPQISTPKIHFCTSPIKSFCRSAAFPPPLAALFFVADATNLCASRYYRRLFRLCNFPTESLSLPGQHTCMLRSSPQSRRAPYTNLKTSPREYQPF